MLLNFLETIHPKPAWRWIKFHYQGNSVQDVDESSQNLSVAVRSEEGSHGSGCSCERNHDRQILPGFRLGSSISHELTPAHTLSEISHFLNLTIHGLKTLFENVQKYLFTNTYLEYFQF